MYSTLLPPGTIGQRQLRHGRVPGGKIQPVRLSAPEGAVIAGAQSGSFGAGRYTSASYGLEVGRIYRFEVRDIPLMEGVALYPSVELIGFLSPPQGKERDFPVPIVFTIEDLRIAAQGGLVTRVVYVEDPDAAIPGMQRSDDQPYFEVARDQDPLHVAEDLGRPVAIVRIGSKTPSSQVDHRFTFDSPFMQEFSTSSPVAPVVMHSVPPKAGKVRQVVHTRPQSSAPSRVRSEPPAKLSVGTPQDSPGPLNLAPKRQAIQKKKKRSYAPTPLPAHALRNKRLQQAELSNRMLPVPVTPQKKRSY